MLPSFSNEEDGRQAAERQSGPGQASTSEAHDSEQDSRGRQACLGTAPLGCLVPLFTGRNLVWPGLGEWKELAAGEWELRSQDAGIMDNRWGGKECGGSNIEMGEAWRRNPV